MGTRKTADRYEEIAVVPDREEPAPPAPNMMAMLNELAAQAAAAEAAGEPVRPAAAGTFAVYVTPQRSLLLVTSVDDPDSPLAGERSIELPAGIIRSAVAFGSGGGKIGALKAMFGGG